MTAEFEFLKPWHAALQNILTTSEPRTVLQASFSLPVRYNAVRTFYVKLSVDERSRCDITQLQHLREAFELFTALSFVNNRAFAKFFPSSRPDSSGEFCYSYPKWCVRLSGTLPGDGFAAIKSPLTWNTLFGFPDDSCGYSSDFQVAIHKLKTMGMEKEVEKYIKGNFEIDWVGTRADTIVYGGHKIIGSADTLGDLLVGFRSLFNLNVPPLAQLYATDNGMTLANAWQKQEPPCKYLLVYVLRNAEIQGLVAALSKTKTAKLSLKFDCITLDTTQLRRNVGEVLATLVTDCSLKNAVCNPRRGKYGIVNLTCLDVSDTVFIGTCSAIAELSSDIHFPRLERYSAKFTRWSWLTYALCCGGSESTIPSAEIARDTLTKADILAIDAVLKTNYPLPVLENGLEAVARYGFVEIREGAHLYLGEFSDSNETRLVNSCASRCRALYNPGSTDADAVKMIVPGYGVCKGRLGDDIQFTPDCGSTKLQQKRLSGSLDLRYLHMENAALLMNLLTLITRGLRKLTLIGEETSIIHIDLTALSAACSDLQELYAGYYSMVEISARNEALRSWPIKVMTIHHNNCVSELSSCLKDPSVRMSRELEKLEMRRPRYLPFSNENVNRLEAHDGEFLPVTKEKLPFQVRIAMISAVASSGLGLKALYLLDEHLLSLIFVFSSTPAQREVKVHD